MRRLISALVAAAMLVAPAFVSAVPVDDRDAFITELLSKMTIEEKIGQMHLPAYPQLVTGGAYNANIDSLAEHGLLGGIFNILDVEGIRHLQELAVEKSRMGIPLLVGLDVVHGYNTIFPIPLALASSWDIPAIERTARIAAKEASAGGINWTFSPMVDISRDPRWGRQAEGAGEDPFLGAAIARAMVRGYQGDNLSARDNILACVKHFALYGAAEGGRDYNTVDMSRQQMFNVYFPPYKAAVEAGAGSVMSSFNLVDGLHATANKWLLTDVLRRMWGFKGFVVTDYASIAEMGVHGFGSLERNSVAALEAGTDMDMTSDAFIRCLKNAVDRGEVTMERINTSVRRILEAKYDLGLFRDPYKYSSGDCDARKANAADAAFARRMAAETFVLLKNQNSLLPLKPTGKIALIGPLADTGANMVGTWSVTAHGNYPSLLDAMREAVGSRGEVIYAKGANLYSDAHIEAGATPGKFAMRDSRSEEAMLAEAVAVAKQADVIVAALGEGAEGSGEGSSRARLTLPDTQHRLLEALLATGKPVVMLNFSGRATVLTWESEHVPAIMNVWFGGSEAADAIADVVFGKVSPSGKLTVSMPYCEGQIPVYYNHLVTGRPKRPDDGRYAAYTSNYFEIPNHPLYPFGYGLSYTTFEYSDLLLSSDRMDADGSITASVTVTNTGNRRADEVVQLYLHDVERSLAPPVQELKGFERISLDAGESRTVTFTIDPSMLKFYNYNLDYVAEPGEFEVMTGGCSDRCLKASFNYME